MTAGLSPAEAEAAGLDCLVASFPCRQRRAMTLESTDGFVRVVARRDNHLVLGWQAVGRGVSELAAAFSQSLEMGATRWKTWPAPSTPIHAGRGGCRKRRSGAGPRVHI